MFVVNGERASARLLEIAAREARFGKVLFIDCDNSCDPHKLMDKHAEEIDTCLEQIHVIQAELLYALREHCRHLPQYIEELRPRCIIVTPFHRVYHYQDEKENEAIFDYVWQVLRKCSIPCYVAGH